MAESLLGVPQPQQQNQQQGNVKYWQGNEPLLRWMIGTITQDQWARSLRENKGIGEATNPNRVPAEMTRDIHAADLMAGRNKEFADKEIELYKRTVDILKPFITGTNPDGTYNLKIPAGTIFEDNQSQIPLWTKARQGAPYVHSMYGTGWSYGGWDKIPSPEYVWSGVNLITNGDGSAIFDALFNGMGSAYGTAKANYLNQRVERNPNMNNAAAAAKEAETARKTFENKRKINQQKADKEVRMGRVGALSSEKPMSGSTNLSSSTLLG